jgi:hypothetical protein
MSNPLSLPDLQSLNAVRVTEGKPPLDWPVAKRVNFGLANINHPAIRLPSFFIDGVEQVHGRTTNIIRSHVAITHAREGAIEEAMVVARKEKNKPGTEKRNMKRRWSVACHAFSWGDDGEYDRNPKWNEGSDTMVYGRVDADSLYARNYIPTGNSDTTVFETANTSINEGEFHDLMLPGFAGWFHDNTVNISFDVLERALECDQHRIALLPVGIANNLHSIGVQFGKPGTPQYDTALLDKLRDKKYLLIPISDAYRHTHKVGAKLAVLNAFAGVQDETYAAWKHLPLPNTSVGRHWTLLFVSVRNSTLQARFFNSQLREGVDLTKVREDDNYKSAWQVLKGVRNVLNHISPSIYTTSTPPELNIDWHITHQ